MDDCIFFSKENAAIEKVIDSLKDEFLLEREDDIAGFLGLKIDRNKTDGTITLTQTGLIDMILSAINMESANRNYTPAAKEPLHKDLNGEPCCE